MGAQTFEVCFESRCRPSAPLELPRSSPNLLLQFASDCLPYFIYDPQHICNNPKSIATRAACKNSKKCVVNVNKARIAIHILPLPELAIKISVTFAVAGAVHISVLIYMFN
jgi:hypothetical protein